mgnify:CR=1 FL=1
MAVIKLKNGSGAPLPADLIAGEPALDLTNKRLYTEDSGGSVIEVGSNPSKLVINGEIQEKEYVLAGTVIDPANGTIQYKTLAANTTFTESLSNGEYVTLMIDDGSSYTITWPTITWLTSDGSAPSLQTTGYTVFELWKVSATLYGAVVNAA